MVGTSAVYFKERPGR